MMKITELKGTDLDRAVAIAEGIVVVDHKGHVAQELPFSPEGPANDFHPQNKCMWRFYEPSKDWAIAGPIIERERICIMHSDSSDPDTYSWTFYTDEESSDVLFECDGDTALEAAMRSYCRKVFGVEIDFDTVKYPIRTAIVRVSGMKDFQGELDENNFLDCELEIEACTNQEAEQLALSKYDVDAISEHGSIYVTFLRWK